jgi:hypothetical protein
MSEATRRVFGKDNKSFYKAIDKLAANSRKKQSEKKKGIALRMKHGLIHGEIK